ncbi:MAG: MFS transporter, partial [Candidatus Woesearchaeota archaeon]
MAKEKLICGMKKRGGMPEKEKIRKSLKYSVIDGAFNSAKVGFGESFLSAFAVFLSATNLQIGLIGSLPRSLGSMSQLLSNRMIHLFKSRKRLVLTGVFVEALTFIPIMLSFFFGNIRVYHLIFFVCLYWIANMIMVPAWSSWMGDLVNPDERGSYFGRRNKIAGLTSFVCFLAAGYLLQEFAHGTKTQYTGFVVIFFLAMAFRLVSLLYLSKEYEPPYITEKKAQFGFVEFVKQARYRNFGLFALYLSLMNFAVFMAAPYFIAYELNDLKLTYLAFTMLSASQILVKNLSMPIWGKASDRFGTLRVLTLCGYLMPLVPLLWLFKTDIWYLVIIEMYSGFVWAGFELSSFNFIFDTTSPEKRSTCVAYYNVLNGVAIFAGAMVGGIIVKYNNIFWSKYLLVMLASGIMRLFATLIFIPRIREVRPVQHIPYWKLFFRVATVAPTEGL